MPRTTMAKISQQRLTVPNVARLWGIAPVKVHKWIAAGELKAINLATDRNGRPRWTISPEDLAEFERSRSNLPVTGSPSLHRAQDNVRLDRNQQN